MMHATIFSDAPRGVDAVAQAARHLEFASRPDDGGNLEPPDPLPPATASPEAGALLGPGWDSADFTGYSVVIATHPHYWTTATGEPEPMVARRRVEVLADMIRNVFPGVRCDLVPGPVEKLDLSSGPDARVRERLEVWVDQQMNEMLSE